MWTPNWSRFIASTDRKAKERLGEGKADGWNMLLKKKSIVPLLMHQYLGVDTFRIDI